MNDKNSVIGISLMVLLTVLYFVFMPKPPETPTQTETPTSDTAITSSTPETPADPDVISQGAPEEDDSTQAAVNPLQTKYGDFGKAMEGEEQFIEVKTDKLVVKLSTKGGKMVSAVLNEHKTFDSLPLPIIREDLLNEFYFQFIDKNSLQAINTSDLYFTTTGQRTLTVNGENTREVVMTAKINDQQALEQVYTFTGDKYSVDYELRLQGIRKTMKNGYLDVFWNAETPKTEKDIKPQRQKTQVVYFQNDDTENIGGMTGEDDEEAVKGEVDWISYKSQFFSYILIPESGIRSPVMSSETPLGNDDISKKMMSNFQMDISGNNSVSAFTFYLGPNEYGILASYDKELEEEMDLGYLFISHINILTIKIFKFFEGFIPNYGLIILLFAILVKLIVFPMTYKSYVSMAKLRVINNTPEIKAIDEKFKGDAQKLQMEKMAIYRKMGVSPLGGCLPMLLQWPILISMFFFFPQSVELRQKSFLWATDLSTYDSIFSWTTHIPLLSDTYGNHISLFTLLMAISIYVYTYYQQKSQPTNAAMPFMKYLPYMMPIIFVFFLNNYASGLSWYYFAANIISIAQTVSIRASLNDEKLLEEMRKKTKKSKKGGKGGSKGGGKSRLERWAESQQKKQQELARARQQGKGNSRSTRRKK